MKNLLCPIHVLCNFTSYNICNLKLCTVKLQTCNCYPYFVTLLCSSSYKNCGFKFWSYKVVTSDEKAINLLLCKLLSSAQKYHVTVQTISEKSFLAQMSDNSSLFTREHEVSRGLVTTFFFLHSWYSFYLQLRLLLVDFQKLLTRRIIFSICFLLRNCSARDSCEVYFGHLTLMNNVFRVIL